MPYDSNGVWSLTPGYLAVTGQVVAPLNHNPPLEDISANGLSAVLVRDGRAPMTGPLNMGTTNKIVNLAPGTAQTDAATVGQAVGVYATKSGNYTPVLADNGATHRYTAAATVSLTAAATLGSNWRYTIIAYGGDVLVDPNSTELINGLPTMAVPLGSSATIVCDGSAFYTIMKPAAWENIGSFAPSAVTQVVVTNLGVFRRLRLTGYVVPASAAAIFIQTSIDNGSSFAGGAADYTYQDLIAANTTVAGSRSTASGMAITANSVSEGVFQSVIENFNVGGQNAVMNSMLTILQTGNRGLDFTGAARADGTARNALRMLMSGSVAFTGNFVLEGVRS